MKIGILGSGFIVRQALTTIEALKEVEVAALWVRNRNSTSIIALDSEFALPQIFAGQEQLADFFADTTFDTVYVALPNASHFDYARQALNAGKNVILEKPFTMTYEEAQALAELARFKNLFLFEAIMSRYSANYQHLRASLDKIGPVKLVQANYSQYSSRYNRYMQGTVLPAFSVPDGGGALMDLNIYCLHFVEGLFGLPEDVAYWPNLGWNGIDTSGVCLLDYGPFKAVCSGAKDSASRSGVIIQGVFGTIYADCVPGRVENVTLVQNGQTTSLDVKPLGDPMADEFLAMDKVMKENDHATADRWLRQTVEVMQIVDKARKVLKAD